MPDLAPAIILGIDPGTRATGWGVVRIDGAEPAGVEWGVIAPAARLPLEERLAAIYTELGAIVARLRPDAVAIEEPFVGANVRSAMAVGEARTVAMLAATLSRVPVHHYAPASVKRMVAGYGQGEKAQVREMLRLQLGMATMPDDLNASDALAVALCHAMHHRAGTLVAEADAGGARRARRRAV